MVGYRFFSILGQKSYYPPKDGMLTLLCRDGESGTHLLLPVDIAKANYLLPALDSPISSTELIIRRAITLQKRREQLSALREKVYEARIQAADRFKKEHSHTIKQFDFRLWPPPPPTSHNDSLVVSSASTCPPPPPTSHDDSLVVSSTSTCPPPPPTSHDDSLVVSSASTCPPP